MPYPSIALSDNTPRDSSQLKKKLPLYKGIKAYFFFGLLALISPFFIALMMVSSQITEEINWWFPSISFFIGEVIAFTLLFIGTRNYQRRIHAFSHGKKVKGRVIHHGRKFIFWKSNQNFTITVVFEIHAQTIHHLVQSSQADLLKQFPVGTTIWGLWDSGTNALCVPAEIGLVLEVPQK